MFGRIVQTDGSVVVLGSDLDGVVSKQPNSTKAPGSVLAVAAGRAHAVALMAGEHGSDLSNVLWDVACLRSPVCLRLGDGQAQVLPAAGSASWSVKTCALSMH
jgi:hypothetical protein